MSVKGDPDAISAAGAHRSHHYLDIARILPGEAGYIQTVYADALSPQQKRW
jgi:hypothetical protein